jgi:hypothetical protein
MVDMNSKIPVLAFAFLASLFGVPHAMAGDTVPVTVDNFSRAESDMYFAATVKEAGGVGKLLHRREVVSVDKQPVVRATRDTL